MTGVFVVFLLTAVAVGCLVGLGGNRNRFGTVHMRLGQHNMAYFMDDAPSGRVSPTVHRAEMSHAPAPGIVRVRYQGRPRHH
jgi:hypothetical protein